MGAGFLLPRLVGMAHATELLMFGDKDISRSAPTRSVLLIECCQHEELLPTAQEWAARLATLARPRRMA